MLKNLAYIAVFISLFLSLPVFGKGSNTTKAADETAAGRKLPPAQLVMYPAEMVFGTVHVGDTIVQEFHVGNISDSKCVLALKPTSDCVSATLKPSNIIEPHESYILEVRLIAKRPKRRFKCKVNFVGNIKSQPFFLNITGNIVE